MASQGPTLPTVGTTLAMSMSDWTNPSGITASGGSSATSTSAFSGSSNYLVGITFGFSIPLDATITGVGVTLGRESDVGNVSDGEVRLVMDNSPFGPAVVGDNLADGPWDNNAEVKSYGGDGALWDVDPTPAQSNHANFGAAVLVFFSDADSASVDYMTMTIWYTEAGGGARYATSTVVAQHFHPAFTE